MAGVVGVFLVIAASVSWYVNDSLKSKVDPDSDGYGEGMQYVKYKDRDMPTYNIKLSSYGSMKNFVVLFIQEYDCKKDGVTEKQHQDKYKELWGLAEDTDLRLRCGEKTRHIPFTMNYKTQFVNYIFEEVKGLLEKKKTVLLAGHSYGGDLACNVAEEINLKEEGLATKLRLATFGSTYIANTNNLQNCEVVTHYMIEDDIALRTNTLKTPKGEGIQFPHFDKKTRVIWLNHKIDNIGTRWNPMNKVRKSLHMSYDEVISAVIKMKGYRLESADIKLH